MGLIGKIAALAIGNDVKETVQNRAVDGAINSVLKTLGRAAGQKPAAEHIKEIKKNYLLIKTKSYSLRSAIGLLTGRPPSINGPVVCYQIFDSNGILKYKTEDEITITDRDVMDLVDSKGNKIGYVKEHLISTGVPLLEKEVKKCSVFLGKQKIAELKKYISFGDLEFEAIEGNVKITHKEGKNFQIYYNGKRLASLHDCPLVIKDGYMDKFVMEYDDPADEVVGILLATAIDLINA